jgi:hypothetical protein
MYSMINTGRAARVSTGCWRLPSAKAKRSAPSVSPLLKTDATDGELVDEGCREGRNHHGVTPDGAPGGSSSRPVNGSGLSFSAPAGGLNEKASGGGSTPDFQVFTRSVYCGASLMVLLVITALRRIGRSPASTQYSCSVLLSVILGTPGR